jgi:predicted transcriptional regulator
VSQLNQQRKQIKKGFTNVDNFLGLDERQVQIYESVNEFHAAGLSNREIAKLLRIGRSNVGKYIDGDFVALCQKKLRSGMDVYHDYIVKSLKAGLSRKDIYDNVVAKGFKGKLSGAYDYMNKLVAHYSIEVAIFRSSSPDAMQKRKQIEEYDYVTRTDMFSFLWMNKPLSPGHRDYIYSMNPQICELATCVKEFRQIFDAGRMPLLYLFVEKYKQSDIKLLSVFAKGLEKDMDAVENAVGSNLSNGFVEGTVSKLKTAKRVMYGRASRKLLSAKMMYSPNSS